MGGTWGTLQATATGPRLPSALEATSSVGLTHVPLRHPLGLSPATLPRSLAPSLGCPESRRGQQARGGRK